MYIPPNVDRETFQQLLSNAFAVQQSQIAHQSLADIMEVQRSIQSGQLDVEDTMRHIVESARKVSDATGVAIGLVHADQLTYWAGSGSCADFIGKQVTASLTVSTLSHPRREILRVENAAADNRIQADICRQYGANSLLILPIQFERALAGVLEVLFAGAHAFEEREIRTYRLMVELIESAMQQSVQLEQESKQATTVASNATVVASEQFEPEEDYVHTPAFTMLPNNEYSLYQRVAAVVAAMGEMPIFKKPVVLGATLVQRARDLKWLPRVNWRPSINFRSMLTWRPTLNWRPSHREFAVMAAVLFVFTAVLAYRAQRSAQSLESNLPVSTAPAQPVNVSKPSPATGGVAAPAPSMAVAKQSTRSVRGVKQPGAGNQEIRYFGDDVTVRIFHTQEVRKPRLVSQDRVAHIGDDVTVRYFAPQPAKSSTR